MSCHQLKQECTYQHSRNQKLVANFLSCQYHEMISSMILSFLNDSSFIDSFIQFIIHLDKKLIKLKLWSMCKHEFDWVFDTDWKLSKFLHEFFIILPARGGIKQLSHWFTTRLKSVHLTREGIPHSSCLYYYDSSNFYTCISANEDHNI